MEPMGTSNFSSVSLTLASDSYLMSDHFLVTSSCECRAWSSTQEQGGGAHPLPSHTVPFLASSPTPALCLQEDTAHCTTTMEGEGASYSPCISFTHPTTSNPSASPVDVAFFCVLFSLSTAPILVPVIIISHLNCHHHLLTSLPASILHSTILHPHSQHQE